MRPLLALCLTLAACAGSVNRPVAPGDSGVGTEGMAFPDSWTGNADGWSPVPDGPAPPDVGPLPDGPLPPDSQQPADTLAPDTAPPCSSYPEKLDGKDNNCNGQIDEGFWANLKQATYGALTAQHPSCSASNAFSDNCTSAAHRLCSSQGYVGGYGPVEYGPTAGTIVCLADALKQQVSYSALTAKHPGCTASTPFSLSCNSAHHRYCKDQPGYFSGVGPVEHSGTNAQVICVKHASVLQVSFAVLASHHSGCVASKAFSPDCQAAINRYCKAQGHATGFGPVEQNVDAWVTCLH